MSQRRISWYSCGAASAIATKLTNPDVVAYCDTGSEHQDNKRFMRECEDWIGQKFTVLRSDEYADTWEVFEKTRWLAGINGARCTTVLKIVPRLEFQKPTDIHVFGYTADGPDIKRAELLQENYPELSLEFPLIERGIDKSACLSLVESAGIEIPIMYKLGFQNNNCIPCVKATSASYWALIRAHFPRQFERMAKLSRELNVRLCRINVGGELVRAFIDEIPQDQSTNNPIAPSCDFLCHLVDLEIGGAQ